MNSGLHDPDSEGTQGVPDTRWAESPLVAGSSVCVTGAAGFIGSHLCEQLLALGCDVTGVDSFHDYYPRHIKETNLRDLRANSRFRLLEDDLLTLRQGNSRLQTAISESSFVYHLAAQAGVRASWGSSFRTYVDNNIYATQLLLETVKESAVEKLVYASSSSVYGDSVTFPLHEEQRCTPVSPYGVSKLACEHLCATYGAGFGVPGVSLRFFTVYGPRQRPDMGFHKFIKAALTERKIRVYGDGLQTRDFTYVSDIVAALVRAAGAPNGLIANVGGGSSVCLRDTLHLISDITGHDLKIGYGASEPGDVRHTSASLEAARTHLGYEPKVRLEEGLREEARWVEYALSEGLL